MTNIVDFNAFRKARAETAAADAKARLLRVVNSECPEMVDSPNGTRAASTADYELMMEFANCFGMDLDRVSTAQELHNLWYGVMSSYGPDIENYLTKRHVWELYEHPNLEAYLLYIDAVVTGNFDASRRLAAQYQLQAAITENRPLPFLRGNGDAPAA